MEPTTAAMPRWARGAAVALVTAPGVLLAHLATTGTAPSTAATLLVCAVVAAVAGVLPTGGARATAAVAAVAQLAGHAALAIAVPRDTGGTGCLSVVGRGAHALVHPASACPPGAVPVPLGVVAVLAAVLAAAGAALLVLAGSGVLALVAGAVVAMLAAGAGAVRVLLRAVLPTIVHRAALRLPVPAQLPVPLPAPAPLPGVWHPGTPARRGPPAVPAAV